MRAPASTDPLIELLARGSRRDAAAVRALYAASLPRLRALARRLMGDADQAEDVLQLAYVRIWARAEDYDVHRGSAIGWMLRLCRNIALDELRRRKVNAVRDARHAEAVALAGAAAGQGDRFHEMIAALDAGERGLLTAIYVEGWSHSEVAVREGLPAGTAKSRLRRAVA